MYKGCEMITAYQHRFAEIRSAIYSSQVHSNLYEQIYCSGYYTQIRPIST
jgi:hypothetical protein